MYNFAIYDVGGRDAGEALARIAHRRRQNIMIMTLKCDMYINVVSVEYSCAQIRLPDDRLVK